MPCKGTLSESVEQRYHNIDLSNKYSFIEDNVKTSSRVVMNVKKWKLIENIDKRQIKSEI